jgi:hypothetical protein
MIQNKLFILLACVFGVICVCRSDDGNPIIGGASNGLSLIALTTSVNTFDSSYEIFEVLIRNQTGNDVTVLLGNFQKSKIISQHTTGIILIVFNRYSLSGERTEMGLADVNPVVLRPNETAKLVEIEVPFEEMVNVEYAVYEVDKNVAERYNGGMEKSRLA